MKKTLAQVVATLMLALVIRSPARAESVAPDSESNYDPSFLSSDAALEAEIAQQDSVTIENKLAHLRCAHADTPLIQRLQVRLEIAREVEREARVAAQRANEARFLAEDAESYLIDAETPLASSEPTAIGSAKTVRHGRSEAKEWPRGGFGRARE